MKYIYILVKKKSYDLFLKIFFIIYYLILQLDINYLKMEN